MTDTNETNDGVDDSDSDEQTERKDEQMQYGGTEDKGLVGAEGGDDDDEEETEDESN